MWYVFNVSVVLSNKWIFTFLPMPTGLTLMHQESPYHNHAWKQPPVVLSCHLLPLLPLSSPELSCCLLQTTGFILSTIMLSLRTPSEVSPHSVLASSQDY